MEPIEFRLDMPNRLKEQLQSIEWGYQSSGGVVTAYFCPLCYAMVPSDLPPPGHPPPARTGRQIHIEYHVGVAGYFHRSSFI